MHFVKGAFLFLLSAAVAKGFLSNAPSSDLVPPSIAIENQELNLYEFETNEAFIKRAGEPCASALRRLAVRNDVTIKEGQVAGRKFGTAGRIFTAGLASCIGVAVVGEDSLSHQRVRVLGHFWGSKLMNEDVLQKFKRECEEAYLDKTRPITLVMSVPNQYGAPPAGRGWIQSDIEGGEEGETDLVKKLEEYLGVCANIKRRVIGMDPPATMSIEDDGRILIDDIQVT